MPRAPFQVVVFPFRRRSRLTEFAVFRRSNNGLWQGIAGGGEDAESPAEAARRESMEEARIPTSAPYYRLDTTNSIPAELFGPPAHWPKDLVVIPNYAFAVDVGDHDIVLSHEHTELRWGSFSDGIALLHYESNRIALGELQERLLEGRLVSA